MAKEGEKKSREKSPNNDMIEMENSNWISIQIELRFLLSGFVPHNLASVGIITLKKKSNRMDSIKMSIRLKFNTFPMGYFFSDELGSFRSKVDALRYNAMYTQRRKKFDR